MTNERREVRFNSIPTIEITDEESRPIRSESASDVGEQLETILDEIPTASARTPKQLPRTPPDSLMFPLFSAIQRGAWTRAKKLSYELFLCDPDRTNYLDLYLRLEQITRLIDQRHHLQVIPAEITPPSNDAEKSEQEPLSEN